LPPCYWWQGWSAPITWDGGLSSAGQGDA